jgi:hypothetical protein
VAEEDDASSERDWNAAYAMTGLAFCTTIAFAYFPKIQSANFVFHHILPGIEKWRKDICQ